MAETGQNSEAFDEVVIAGAAKKAEIDAAKKELNAEWSAYCDSNIKQHMSMSAFNFAFKNHMRRNGERDDSEDRANAELRDAARAVEALSGGKIQFELGGLTTSDDNVEIDDE